MLGYMSLTISFLESVSCFFYLVGVGALYLVILLDSTKLLFFLWLNRFCLYLCFYSLSYSAEFKADMYLYSVLPILWPI